MVLTGDRRPPGPKWDPIRRRARGAGTPHWIDDDVVVEPDPARFVIRFDFAALDGPRYATLHPDPPHDWALTTTAWELARAISFEHYSDAAQVLDFEYGRRRRGAYAQGHDGRVVILAEEIHDLSAIAQAAMVELRESAR